MINSIDEKDLENVTGGWQYANGDYENYGNFIIYTIAPGDILKNICQLLHERAGVCNSSMSLCDFIHENDKSIPGAKYEL